MLPRVVAWLPRSCRLAVWISALVMNVPIIWHVARGSRAYLGFFADDFYYYVVVVEKLVTGGYLTFDGSHATNGFHPLWFAVLAVIRLVTGGGGAFYVTLAVLHTALAIATFELYVKLARAVGVRASIAFPCAAYMILGINQFFADGMETNLAVPLCAALLLVVARTSALTLRRAALLGLLSSLVVLARLDLIIMIALMVAAYAILARVSLAAKLRAGLAFGAAAALVPIYLAYNVWAFGALLPTSATAKQMTTSFGANLEFLHRLIFEIDLGKAGVVATFAGLTLLVSSWSPTRAREARLAIALAIAFPIVYYATCILRSPWLFFPWYAYAIFASTVLGIATVGEAIATRFTDPRVAWVAIGIAAAMLARIPVTSVRYALHHTTGWEIGDDKITANAFELARRLEHRPGVYAMGDKAGNVANLLAQPIVQLEGLVADQAMLERIRGEQSLCDALHAYGVDYLIASPGPVVPLPHHDGCYDVTQPTAHEAGERSPKMRARICSEPIEDFEVPEPPHPWAKYDFPIHTYVFDVRASQCQPASAPRARRAASP